MTGFWCAVIAVNGEIATWNGAVVVVAGTPGAVLNADAGVAGFENYTRTT